MSQLSCREQIVAAVKAVIKAGVDFEVDRNRREPLTMGELPRAILFEREEEPNEVFTGQDAFDLTLLVQVQIAGGAEEAARQCNAHRAKLTKALLADRSLGGKSNDLVLVDPGDWIGVDVDAEEDSEGFMLALVVRYATKEGNPYTFA